MPIFAGGRLHDALSQSAFDWGDGWNETAAAAGVAAAAAGG